MIHDGCWRAINVKSKYLVRFWFWLFWNKTRTKNELWRQRVPELAVKLFITDPKSIKLWHWWLAFRRTQFRLHNEGSAFQSERTECRSHMKLVKERFRIHNWNCARKVVDRNWNALVEARRFADLKADGFSARIIEKWNVSKWMNYVLC